MARLLILGLGSAVAAAPPPAPMQCTAVSSHARLQWCKRLCALLDRSGTEPSSNPTVVRALLRACLAPNLRAAWAAATSAPPT